VELPIIEAYNAQRNIADKPFLSACYAPYTSMLFDPLGNVRVCCQNFSLILGSLAHSRLREIWDGPAYRALRRSMDRYKLDVGCEFCEWQISEGSFANTYTREYDVLPVEGPEPRWPKVMEFNISNTCNLQCLMCNGEFSSSIRTKREGLGPLPKVYGDQFFEDLKDFLPHLEMMKCLGGEPFLAHEMFRIWDMMIEQGLQTRCHINTNATTYNAKVERVLDKLPCTFQVSMDGITKKTFESIRVGANFEEVMENFKRLHAYSQREGGYLSLTFCLMRQNWQEMGDFLLFGDEWDCYVSMMPVVFPSTCSLYTLPKSELAEIVRSLESQEPTILPRLGRNKQVWLEQMERLRNRLAYYDSSRPVFASLRLLEPFRGEPEVFQVEQPDPVPAAKGELEDWGARSWGVVYCDEADVVQRMESSDGTFLGLASDRCLGRRVDVLFSQFRVLYGGGTRIVSVDEKAGRVDRILSFSDPSRKPVLVRSMTLPAIGGGSILVAGIRGTTSSPNDEREMSEPSHV
jgi:MoaA/NifB/PqqE/SkfB family radical SAM enzyme